MSSTNAAPAPAAGTKNVPSIAIVGGGIAGLALALNLVNLAKNSTKPHYSITIYESAHAFGEIGAGVSFGPNASHAMKCIGPQFYEAFKKTETKNQFESKKDVWFDFRFGESVDGKYKVGAEEGTGPDDRTGELIATVKCNNGQRGVKRSVFLDELIKHVPQGMAKFGKRVTHYTTLPSGHVTMYFKDGSSATHDALVACDGIKSNIRKTLLASTARPDATDAVFSGKYCYRGLVPMDEAVEALGEEMAKNAQMYLGRHGHILTFAVAKGEVMNGQSHLASKVYLEECSPLISTALQLSLFSQARSGRTRTGSLRLLTTRPSSPSLQSGRPRPRRSLA